MISFPPIVETISIQYTWGIDRAYTKLHMFSAGNQGNHQNFNPSLLPKKEVIFMGMKQKKIFFEKKYFKMAAELKRFGNN